MKTPECRHLGLIPNLKTRPSWSPDGTEIAYPRLNDFGIWDVWKVPALGGVPQRLISNGADPIEGLDLGSHAVREQRPIGGCAARE